MPLPINVSQGMDLIRPSLLKLNYDAERAQEFIKNGLAYATLLKSAKYFAGNIEPVKEKYASIVLKELDLVEKFLSTEKSKLTPDEIEKTSIGITAIRTQLQAYAAPANREGLSKRM